MNTKELRLDNACLGQQMLLVAIVPDMYVNGQRVSEPVGYRYDVCLRAHGMDKLSVRISGRQQMDAPLPEADVYVRFENLTVRPYVNGNGRLALTATASAIRPVDPAQAKGRT